jgi:fructoselysine-6-P-deglycase FrlB-like protein
METLLTQPDPIQQRWLDTLDQAETLLFVGHGPHAATARQAAMMVAEWAKLPALHSSVGAFRHGFIEVTRPGLGVVVFVAPGPALASGLALASQLQDYGARVLLVENGRTRLTTEAGATHLGGARHFVDEFLSPILDIIPAQIYVDALARRLGVVPGFRYISKVVTQL